MSDTTRERTLDVGLRLLQRHGYNDLGVQAVLEEAGIPKDRSITISPARRILPCRSSTVT